MKNLDLLIPQSERMESGWQWATVSSINPLRIRLDGDDTPLGITPDSLVKDLVVGNRVWVQLEGRRVIVHGASASQGAVSAIPVGTVQMYAANPTNAPEGWLYCKGGTFLSTTYPALANLLGDTYGTHSGTTYYLPDFRARSPIGIGGAAVPAVGGNSYSLGQKYGDERLQQHNHGVSDPGHTHGTYGRGSTWGANNYWGTPDIWFNATAYGGDNSAANVLVMGSWWNGTYSATTGLSIQNNGSGTAGNVHPVLGVNFIIKT